MTGNKQIWFEPVLGLNREKFIARCQQAILSRREDSFIYLVATRPLLDEIATKILDGQRVKACRELRVFLFDGLVRRILKHSGEERRLIEDATKSFLLEQTVTQLAQAGALKHIQDIALLPGCIASLTRIIGEIKRSDMSPETFQELVMTASPHPRDHDVALIYQAYNLVLDRLGLMDSDDAYVRALEVLRARADLPPWVQPTEVLFVDGFFDFTPIQKKLLRYLIERIPEVIINLVFDPENPSVFQEPLRDTLTLFSTMTEPMATEQFHDTAAYDAGLKTLRQGLFNPNPSGPNEAPPIRVLAASTFSHEVEEIAKEVKRLISEDGYAASEMAVIARDPSYLEALSDELNRIGVPSALDLPRPLMTVPVVKAAAKILDCRATAEATEPYVALLKNDYLNHFSQLDRDAIENAMIAVGTQVGVHQFRKRLRDTKEIKEYQAKTLTARMVDVEEVQNELARLQRGQSALEAALEAIDGMRNALELIPRQGRISDLIHGFARAIGAFGLRQRLRELLETSGKSDSDLRVIARDLRGLQALDQVLGDILLMAMAQRSQKAEGRRQKSEGRSQKPDSDSWFLAPEAWLLDEELPAERFRDLLFHLLEQTEFKLQRGDPAGVHLLEGTQARGLGFKVVFIPGLVEGVFPRSPDRDWIYPDPERQKLAEAGLFLEDLSPKVFRAKEEHFFYHAACQATERLYLTYPRADQTGQETIVSGFVEEVRQLYAQINRLTDKSDESVNQFISANETLVIVEDLDPVAYSVRSVASTLELEKAVLASLYQTTADDPLVLRLYHHAINSGLLTPPLFARVGIEHLREGEDFGPFDGLLTDRTIRQQLSARYGPKHVYSPSQLNTYGRCPFQFFCQRILRLEPREEASLDLVALDRGFLLHSILHDFLERHTKVQLVRERRREYQEEMRKVAEDIFSKYEEKALPINCALWDLQKAEIVDTLIRFLDAEIDYQQQVSIHQVRPHWLELGFGMSSDEKGRCHPDSVREYLVLTRPLPSASGLREPTDAIQIRGRIDRADRSADGRYIVYDYKAGGGPDVKEMREGLDLQIQLYIQALRELFIKRGEEVIGGGYYSIRDRKRTNGLYRSEHADYTAIGQRAESNLTTSEWLSLLEQADIFAWEYVDGMRRGDFRVLPKDDECCVRCDFRAVCRYDKHRRQKAEGREQTAECSA